MWFLHSSDSPELVRRRGRWLSPKVMDIYLQVVQSATFLSDQSWETRQKIAAVASSFATTLRTAAQYHQAKLPSSTWFSREDC